MKTKLKQSQFLLTGMVITYYGASCFKVQSGSETVLVFNPPSKNSEFKSPRFQANVVLISKNDKDYNGWDNISSKTENEENPFIIDSPGEYEIAGIAVAGYRDGLNTVYFTKCENINVCHLGAYDGTDLSSSAKEDMGRADILIVPARDEDDLKKISQLIGQINPKIVIPMHYKPADLKKFLDELDGDAGKPVDKLAVKKKDLMEEKTEIIVLKPAI